ncbi:hypothetical protein GUITHDRAFT_77648 [Guillardia theta CCMP2712]|uniref:Bromo domain-containing protein n=1 Tax=Guillardia theta (strain CCMP2712) TaxID=905079 RepID=L1IQ15_GUITC|nr:hypothetical protein GUITHDRAFT_77648 [Guillardia theta CCMP2712]EKX37979.1 hypothetical protein GUITHDRAFT_77648 [Guillardia theta CCMP2712]|eukprot:XP_005824959.1 hypothetical protein GUITHDRAFT_77648 [Guillardia theta CCMP2712]
MNEECHNALLKLLGRLTRQETADPFLEPVDPVEMGILDYFNVVKSPMDLGTIDSNLEHNLYSSPLEVLEDVLHMLDNAVLYNKPGDAVVKQAAAMKTKFISLVNGSEVRLESSPSSHLLFSRTLASMSC